MARDQRIMVTDKAHDARKMKSSVRKQLLPAAACLLAVASFMAYWSYLDGVSRWHLHRWLTDVTEASQTALGPVDAVEYDQQHLRSLLSPQDHIHRPPQTIRHHWTVTAVPARPDGVRRSIYMINGHFPGPTVEARSGDDVEIEVHNLADAGISIHWHGLSMKGANEMDGVAGLTQCAIGRNQTFTYRFHIADTQHGTFWYHAHAGLQTADGLYGGLVVHEPQTSLAKPDHVDSDQEQLLLIGDWYHRPSQDVLDWFLDPNLYGNDPAPDSLLVNGQGSFNCSMAMPAFPVDCVYKRPPAITLYGLRTRLRIVNTGSLTGFTIAIPDHHLMRLVQVDGGGPVSNGAPATSIGVLYPGERMDILVERPTDRHKETSFLIALDDENLRFKNFALTPVQTFHLEWQLPTATPPPKPARKLLPPVEYYHLETAQGPLNGRGDMPLIATEKAVLYTRMEVLPVYTPSPVGLINDTSWLMDNGTALLSPVRAPLPLLAQDREHWPYMRQPGETPNIFLVGQVDVVRHVPWFQHVGSDVWMDLVINNLDEKGHPFHLHGFSFHVLSTWRSDSFFGGYNPFKTDAAPPGGPYNTTAPLVKDTVYIPRAGYVVLRLRLDNPGLWMLHCHTLWHHAAGMGMALQVGPPADAAQKQEARVLCQSGGKDKD